MSLGKVISKILLVKSFVFGALVLVVWARSYFVADVISVRVGLKSTTIASANGLIVYRAAADGNDKLNLQHMTRRFETEEPRVVLSTLPGGPDGPRTLGFSYDKRALFEDGSGIAIWVTVPFWFLFLVGGSRAIYWLARRQVRKTTKVPLAAAWCAKCQCMQPSENNRCTACGAAVAAAPHIA